MRRIIAIGGRAGATVGHDDRSVCFATRALEQVGSLEAPVCEGELRTIFDS